MRPTDGCTLPIEAGTVKSLVGNRIITMIKVQVRDIKIMEHRQNTPDNP